VKITPRDRLAIIAIRQTSKISNAEIGRLWGISTQHVRWLLKQEGIPSRLRRSPTTKIHRQVIRQEKMRKIHSEVCADLLPSSYSITVPDGA
jgi:hypothetical protein